MSSWDTIHECRPTSQLATVTGDNGSDEDNYSSDEGNYSRDEDNDSSDEDNDGSDEGTINNHNNINIIINNDGIADPLICTVIITSINVINLSPFCNNSPL